MLNGWRQNTDLRRRHHSREQVMRDYIAIGTVGILGIGIIFDVHFVGGFIIFIMEGYGVFELLDEILIDGFAAL